MNTPTLSQPPGRASRSSPALVAIALISTALVGCCVRGSMVDIGPLASAPAKRITVAAHRASPLRREFPDNSLLAARASVQAGIPFIELDVRMSRDRELFLFHDGSLQAENSFAPPELRGRSVQSLSAKERQAVWLDRNKTASLPLLSEILDVVRGSRTSVQLDLKQESDQLALAVFELLDHRGQLDQALVQLRSPERARLVKKTYPRARILGRCKNMAALREFLTMRPEFVELERWASSEAIELAHAAGVLLSANVAGSRLDEPATWGYLRSRGFDSIMSDRAREHCRIGACLQ